MTYIVSVVYTPGCKFDMDYYLKTHMPLVQKLWGPHGLKCWKVANYNSPDAPYSVQAWLEWESKDHFDKGSASKEGAEIFGDVPKFCDDSPVILSGDMVGSASF